MSSKGTEIVHCDKHPEIVARLDHLDAKIFGNGEPGLLSDVRSLIERVTRTEACSSDNNARLVKIERLIWIGMGIGIGLQIFQIIVKSLPTILRLL